MLFSYYYDLASFCFNSSLIHFDRFSFLTLFSELAVFSFLYYFVVPGSLNNFLEKLKLNFFRNNFKMDSCSYFDASFLST